MQCYFDGSEAKSPNGHSWLTLAGLIARDHFWSSFNKEWASEVLQKREPHAPFLHMTDLMSGTKAFDGWSYERRQNLIRDAVDFLQSRPKLAFQAVVCTIDKTARDKLLAQGGTIAEPHVLCVNYTLYPALDWYHQHHPEGIELGRIYFDRNERFMHPLRSRWQRKKKAEKTGRIITDHFWGLIVDVDAREMHNTPGVQAADLIAWAMSREHSDITRPYRYLAEIARAVIPNSSVTFDGNTLRDIDTSIATPHCALVAKQA